jgi:hypothetical protein
MGNYASKDDNFEEQIQESIPARPVALRAGQQHFAEDTRFQAAQQLQIETMDFSSGSTSGDTEDVIPTVFKWDNGGRNVYM